MSHLSDAECLRNWGQSLQDRVFDGPMGEWEWAMVIAPKQPEQDVLGRLSVRYHYIVDKVDEHLKFTEQQFGAFITDQTLETEERLWDAMRNLGAQLLGAASVIEEQEAANHNEQQLPSSGGTAVACPSSELVSFTQETMDAAIAKYKSQRASSYSELVSRVENGDPGAQKAARQMFGRNAIGGELKAKRGSYGLISKSPIWKQIAADLRLDRTGWGGRIQPSQKIGLDVALQEHADATKGSPVTDEVEERDEALAKLIAEQQKDAESNRVLGDI